MANILIVTSEYLPLQSSGINRIAFFKRSMEQSGHSVYILTCNSNAQGVKRNITFDNAHNINRTFSLPQIIRRLLSSRRLPIYPTLSAKGIYEVWVPFATRKGAKLIKQYNIDIVFTSFPDFVSLEVASNIVQKTNTKLITEFRDPPFWVYDQTIDTRKINICKNIVKKAISLSENIITCTEQSMKSLKSFYVIKQVITVIANGYDQEIIDQLKTVTKEKKNHFEIVHIGSFYDDGRDIQRIIIAIEEYCRNTPNKITLRLIGDAPSTKIQAFIKRVVLSFKISIEPPLPMIKALTIAKNADVLLLLQGARFDRQIPTKVYEYLALQKSIWAVIGKKGATKELLSKYKQNVIYSDYDDCASIKEGLFKALTAVNVTCDVTELSRQVQTKLLYKLIK